MRSELRWTISDLEAFPESLDDKRYELIDGELYVSTQPHWNHQFVCSKIAYELEAWSRESGAGAVGVAPGVIFSVDEAVAPDVVWVRSERLPRILGDDGKLHGAPDLMVEVLSFGGANERRDRELKLDVYSRRGVSEYWIVDWREREVTVHRRREAFLRVAATLRDADHLETPLLPGFRVQVADLFSGLPETG